MNMIQNYQLVLDQLETIRTDIITKNIDILSFGGVIPEEDTLEIESILKAESVVLSILSQKGIPYQELKDKPQFLEFKIKDKTYINHKNFFTSTISIPLYQNTKDTTVKDAPVLSESKDSENEINPEEEASNNFSEYMTPPDDTIESPKPQKLPENIVRKEDLVFETYKIEMKHKNFNGKPDIFTVTCCPLQLFKYSTPSVPIVVSMANGRTRVTQSSYDTFEAGRNLITLSIKDYEFLIRGSIDENGQFHTLVTTTGNSANQGDQLTVLEHNVYGNKTPDSLSEYGHPIAPYQSDEGHATVSIFPLIDTETDYFIVISKTDEFVHYMECSSAEYGSHIAKVYDEEKGDLSVIPKFTDNTLELTLL